MCNKDNVVCKIINNCLPTLSWRKMALVKNNERLYSFPNIFSCFHSHIVIKLKELSLGLLNYLGCVQNNLLIEENMKIVVYWAG